MTAHVEDVTTRVGLVIDGDIEPGDDGSYDARQRVRVSLPGQSSPGVSA
jgi:hypothetical protein